MVNLVVTSIELALLYSFIVFGVFISFRILRFPDLTIDGSFVTGAAAAAVLIKAGFPGIIALFFGFIAGFLAGCITSFLHIRLGIEKILSGVLTLYALYTINLRILHGPNISLINETNIIPWLAVPVNHIITILFLLLVVLFFKFSVDWFLSTEFGLSLRATGINELTAQSFGINTNVTKWIGLGISNGLAGLGGSLVGQYQGFVDINMGIGAIIIGLAALLIGETLLFPKTIFAQTLAIFVGSLVYQLIMNSALRLGLAGTDLKLVAAFIVVAFLAVGQKVYKHHGKNSFTN